MRLVDLRYQHLLGHKFVHGTSDCYTLIRDFYKDNFSLEFPNYARPDKWWEQGMNLYMDHVFECGFELLDNPRHHDLRACDLILCAIQSKVANHAAVLMGDGYIVHHFINRLSTRELYSGIWRNTQAGIFRHKALKDLTFDVETFDLSNDPRIAKRLANVRAS